MPARGGSAAGSPAPFGSSSRLRSDLIQDNFGNPEINGVLGRPDGNGGEQKVISSLVNRYVNKLPCKSGMRLIMMEGDPGANATVKSIIQMTKIRLNHVLHALTLSLEGLSKSVISGQVHETSFEVLQSQVCLLNLINECLDSHWRRQVESQPIPSSELPRCWPDPAPIDDNVAKYLLTVVLAYARLSASHFGLSSGPGTSSPAPSREGTRGVHSAASSSSSNLAGPLISGLSNVTIRRYSIIPGSRAPLPPKSSEKLSDLCENGHSTIAQLQHLLAAIVFHLSSSNWPIIFTRIKARLHHLATTIDESPDCTVLNLIEWSNLNRSRLSQILQETSSTFLQFKRPAQGPIAESLHSGIRNFLNCHTLELNRLIEENRKIDGGPDTLFDILHSMSDITSSSAAKRTRLTFPLMALLLCLCPDILKRVILGDTKGSGSMSKKRYYVDALRNGLSSSKGFETCLVCYIDFVNVSTRISPKLENSGLAMLVQEIQGDLKSGLLNAIANEDLSDRSVVIDGLIALFKVDPGTITTTVLPKLLNDSMNKNRLIGIKSLQTIVSKGQELPWDPLVGQLRRDIAPLILTLLKGQIRTIIPDSETPTRPRPGPDLSAPQAELVEEILELYRSDPAFILAKYPNSPDLPERTILTLSSLLVSPSPAGLRSAATRTICSFMRYIANGPADDVGFENTVTACSNALWQPELDVHRQLFFAVINADLEDLSDTFIASRDISVALRDVVERFPKSLSASNVSGPACLVGMISELAAVASPDFEYVGAVLPATKALATLTSRAHEIQEPQGTSAENGLDLDTHRGRVTARTMMIQALAGIPPAAGRLQQQRLFRKTLRPFCLPSPGGSAYWVAMAHVIKQLNSTIITASSEITASQDRRNAFGAELPGLSEGHSKFWQNIVLALCNSASACVYDGDGPPPMVEECGRGILPKIFDEPMDARSTCEIFIRDIVDLLTCPSIHVRETIKEGLGTELPLLLLRSVISNIVRAISQCSTPSGMAVSERSTMLLDQTISILKLSVDRLNSNETISVSRIDLGEVLSLHVQYVQRLGKDSISIRIKLRFCQLVETAFKQSETITFGNEAKLRNTIFENLVDWSSDGSMETDLLRSNVAEVSKIQHDLEIACLKAMVPVTEGLLLQPADDTDSKSSTAQSRMFYRYFTHLIRLLERLSSSETISVDSPSTSLTTKSGSGAGIDDPPTMPILVLSNILSANMEVGLRHCMSMGYHEDLNLRNIFFQMMSNILRQGKFGGVTAKRPSTVPRLFLNALTGPGSNMALAVAICEACPSNEVDEMSTLLFRTFEAKGQVLELLRILTEREIAQTNHEPDLFRANSITTRLLTIFAKTYGYNYVRATLQPLIHSLLEKPADTSFELDPAKASPNEDIDRNIGHLQAVCQALLDLIVNSTAKSPVMFRALCYHLWTVVETKFPDSRHSIVGSFIFLRFFCPAIVAPDNIDLDVSPDAKEVRRALLLITKVIQNLASNVMFGNKEPHMKVLNDFLGKNIHDVTKYLSSMATRPRSYEIVATVKNLQDEALRTQDPEGDDAVLQRFLHKHRAKVEASLECLPTFFCQPAAKSDKPMSARSELDGKGVLTHLRRIMEENVVSANLASMTSSARAQVYEDFMKHNSGRSTESVANVFYEGPASQNGRRIFYFIVSRVGLIDYDLLAYHVFHLLDAITDFFDLVFDLTDFSSSTEMPLTWLKRTVQMCPPSILPCIHTLAMYNPNTYAQKRTRRIITELSLVASPIGRNIVAVSSPAELAESIPFTSLALPDTTMVLAYEAEHVFTNLLCLLDHDRQVPVVVKLGQDCMQIASWRKQDLTPSLKSYIIDVIRLNDINDVVTGGNLPQDHLMIKYSQTESMTFISRKRTEMAQIIRAARARLRDTYQGDRTLRASDAPGTLLNVALLNLSASEDSLRTAGYNLVNEICQFYKYEVPAQFLTKVSAGFSIPCNSPYFTYDLSRSLALAAPHLTLAILKEWTIGFPRVDVRQRLASLWYIEPWLTNLDTFAKPSRDTGVTDVKQVEELIRAVASLTVSERHGLHLTLQERVWTVLGCSHEALTDIIVSELLHLATDSGPGSEKAECVADILVSMSSATVRGKVIARLRKTIAQTYLKPTSHLTDHISWNEISTLTRILLRLSFSTTSPLITQMFLPEVIHISTILLGAGPLIIRQSVYGIASNTLQSLLAPPSSGDIDVSVLQDLYDQLRSRAMIRAFGLSVNEHSFELSGLPQKEVEANLLNSVDLVAKFFGNVIAAGATFMDCANAWRARWMGLVAATCFQHNPSTQPQAFTVLGYLASDEVDDDLVYQILVAMGSTLQHFSETENTLVCSMLNCLSKVIPGLARESRYPLCLFWLAVGVLELGYIPLFAAALDLVKVTLRFIETSMNETATQVDVFEALLQSRTGMEESTQGLDQMSGVSFGTDISFSLVAIIFKGFRYPATKQATIEVLVNLLRLSSVSAHKSSVSGHEVVTPQGVAFFIAVLPSVSNSQELEKLWQAAKLGKPPSVEDLLKMPFLSLLQIPDNSTALLLIALSVTMLGFASSDTEKLILYRLLAEAAAEMPEVMAMVYDTLMPRMTATLSTTSSIPILDAITQIIERAMADPNYTFPQSITASESNTSLHLQSKGYNASISSAPSMGNSTTDQVLEDLGMRGIGELTFSGTKMEKVAPMAKWVAGLIESFTI